MEEIETENTGPPVFPKETDHLAEVSKYIHELFLDTKDACFLCLRECSSGYHQISLQGICRFLKIHPTSILINSLKENFDIREEVVATLKEKERNFSVIMCLTCLSLANHLSKLIKQLEIAKMLLAHKLQEFHTLLKTSSSEANENDTTSRWKSVQEKMLKGCEDPVEVHLVEKLRLAATEKCSKIVTTGSSKYSPNVLLERLNPEVINASRTREPSPSPPLDDDFYNDAISGTSEHSEPSQLSSEKVLELPKDPPERDFIWNLLSNSYKVITNNDNPPQKLFQCLHCDHSCTRLHSGDNIRMHVANSHAEKIFSQVKPPLMPESDFRLICGEFLLSEKRLMKCSNGSYKSCNYCKCTYARNSDLGYHLVLTHYLNLEENLKKRLQDPVLPKQNDPPVTSKKVALKLFKNEYVELGYKFQCRHCDYQTDCVSNRTVRIRTHLVSHHLDKLFASEKPDTVTSAKFHESFQTLMEGECSAAKQSEFKLQLWGKKQNGKMAFLEAPFKCGYCQREYWNEANFRYHLVLEHYLEMKSKLEKNLTVETLPISTPDEVILPPKNIPVAAPEPSKIVNILQANYETLDSESKQRCRHCKYESESDPKMHQHLINCHPEWIFLDARVSTVVAKDFEDLCEKMMTAQVYQSTNHLSDKREQFNCSFCKTDTSTENEFKYHLVTEHYSDLAMKLVGLQRNTTMDEDNNTFSRIFFDKVIHTRGKYDSDSDFSDSSEALNGQCEKTDYSRDSEEVTCPEKQKCLERNLRSCRMKRGSKFKKRKCNGHKAVVVNGAIFNPDPLSGIDMTEVNANVAIVLENGQEFEEEEEEEGMIDCPVKFEGDTTLPEKRTEMEQESVDLEGMKVTMICCSGPVIKCEVGNTDPENFADENEEEDTMELD